jgi:feruloyl esterase
MRKSAVIAAGLLAACTAQPEAGAPLAASSALDSCGALAGRDFGHGIAITQAGHIAAAPAGTVGNGPFRNTAALPAHCLVEGMIGQRTGADGKTYGIGFALALPADWSGRFLLMGGGGLNGSVAPPLGPVAAGSNPALARGFAVVSHDSGHKGAVFEASFAADQRAALDFAVTSVFTVSKVAMAFTEAYYAGPIAHSYMTGCSTGGREGMLAIQRYPELFDGVVIGAPAMMTGHSNLAIAKAAVDFNQAAPRDAEGLPIVTEVFTPAARRIIHDGLLAQCDGLDGLEDGVIDNVAQCRFNPQKLACERGQSEGCIPGKVATALERGFQPPRDASGRALYAPFPFDTGIVDPMGGFLPSGRPGPFGPPSRDLAIDVDARIADIRANAMQRLTDTHVWTDLDTFLARGGKTIFYHGVSDFWFSPLATWDWWTRAAETNGAAFTDASRFYMVPGMLHCQGGNAFDRFDLLTEVVDWVEQGEPPERPIAARADGSAGRPLCHYPAYPHYLGGDAAKPESFECRAPGGG